MHRPAVMRVSPGRPAASAVRPAGGRQRQGPESARPSIRAAPGAAGRRSVGVPRWGRHFCSWTGIGDARSSFAAEAASVDLERLPGPMEIYPATTTSEFRAAGYLRAACFYSDDSYPEGRSDFVIRSHRRMKGDMEWNCIENKVGGTEVGYKDTKVACLIGTINCEGESELLGSLNSELDPTCRLPLDDQHDHARLVVASLDINQGYNLPAEELKGTQPAAGDPSVVRAYLSNVCTAQAMRRRGVAAALIEEACRYCLSCGVVSLYVHVAEDNPGARELYTKVAGFEVESEETAAEAQGRMHSRRTLLHRRLQ